MVFSTVHDGAQIALHPPTPSDSGQHRPSSIETVKDLLDKLSGNPPASFSILKTTSGWLVNYLGTSLDEMSIDSVHHGRDGFRPFLESRGFKENSIRTYVNHLSMLLNHAAALGWKPDTSIPKAWKEVAASAKSAHCKKIVWHLMRLRPTPQQVTIEDVDSWADEVVKNGANYRLARKERTHLWRLLIQLGCAGQAPMWFHRDKRVGIPISKFPSSLKNEVLALLHWKQADYVPDRPNKMKIRPATVRIMEQRFASLYGYCINVRGETQISSLRELIRKELISAYLEWCINVRKLNGYSLQCGIRQMFAAFRQYPPLKDLDVTWWKTLHDSIPVEPSSEKRNRKAKKYLDYSVLAEIPSRICAHRASMRNLSDQEVAEYVMYELLALWLAVLAWRQRNVRECRVSGNSPNLVKAKLPVFTEMDKPIWVQQEEQRNPSTEFWQFGFNPDETKMKRRVEAVLPKQLVPLLEEYLRVHRPRLLRGSDPETLFVNTDGRPIAKDQMDELISTLTLRYAGHRVHPHMYRDIAAFAWLKEHPKDYLTLSKILWHKSIAVTIDTYGGRFNESSGVCAMETWLEEREAKTKSK